MIAIYLLLAFAQVSGECVKPFNAGLEHYQRKDFGQALIAFRAAVQCNPKFVQALLAIADIYAERGNEAEALAALLQALTIEPKNTLALRAGASLYLKNGLHNKALPLLEALAEVDARSPDVRADLAAVYAASGNREAAERQFRRALELQSDFFPALAGLGNLLARAGDDASAVSMLRNAAKVQPKAWEGHFLLGAALNRTGQFEEARTELELASTLGGGTEPQVFYQLARAWGGLGKAPDRKTALAKFSELTKKEKDSIEAERRAAAWVAEARDLMQAGDLEKAASRLELAREAKPGDPTLLFRLAGLHFDLKHYDSAREYAQAAISISPTTWLYHYLLGLVEQSANRLKDARVSLEVAATLDASQAPVFHALGQVLLAQGERKAAIETFEKAARLAPNDQTFRQSLEAVKAQ